MDPEFSSSLTDASVVISIPKEQNTTRVDCGAISQSAQKPLMTHGCCSNISPLHIEEISVHPLESNDVHAPFLGVFESHQEDPPVLV